MKKNNKKKSTLGFTGRKHTEETKRKISLILSKKIKDMYDSGVKMGFRSDNAYKTPKGNPCPWKNKKLPWTVWNKGKKGLQSNSNKGKKLPHRSGANSPSWKGGVTKLKDSIRSLMEYKSWRRNIFERDNFTCQICLSGSNKLNADHIVPFSFILKKYNIKNVDDALRCEELWNINNGRTLCFDCHKKTDTYLSKASSYKE